VAAELLEPGGMDATIHTGGHRAAFKAVAAEDGRIEAGGAGARLTDASIVTASMASAPITGPGQAASGASALEGGSQIRLKIGLSVMPEASSNAEAPGSGRGLSLALNGAGWAETAITHLYVLDADGGQFRPAEGTREADEIGLPARFFEPG
jgi:hypothetical protein